MSKLYSSKEISSVLELIGYYFVSQKGSHGKYKNKTGNITILPMNKKEIPEGTFHNILKQSGLTLQQFKKLLK